MRFPLCAFTALVVALASACDVPAERFSGLRQQAYLKPSNTVTQSNFGSSLALSADGTTLAVGAFRESGAGKGINPAPSSGNATHSGAAYVFVRGAAGWIEQAYIKASDAGMDDEFGSSVALSADGNTLAVGAWGQASAVAGDVAALSAGAVYVFVRENDQWRQQAHLRASNIDALDRFGTSIALSSEGSLLVVGAPDEDSSARGSNGNQGNAPPGVAGTDSGAAYVFRRDGEHWNQQAYLKASNTGDGDWFGASVALSGTGAILAIGAPGEASSTTGIDGDQADDSAAQSGAVYVFVHENDQWRQQAYVKAFNTDASDWFGWAVALSRDGATLAVGAQLAASTAIHAGDPTKDPNEAGAVHVFVPDRGTWRQQEHLEAPLAGSRGHFGGSIALSGDGSSLIAGATGEDSAGRGVNDPTTDDPDTAEDSGAVYLFRRSGERWRQRAYVKASNAGMSDHFGAAVALSDDGAILAVGADWESSSATGIDHDEASDGAPNAGAAYAFQAEP